MSLDVKLHINELNRYSTSLRLFSETTEILAQLNTLKRSILSQRLFSKVIQRVNESPIECFFSLKLHIDQLRRIFISSGLFSIPKEIIYQLISLKVLISTVVTSGGETLKEIVIVKEFFVVLVAFCC